MSQRVGPAQYGSTNGLGKHGGSGRVGTSGGFQVKGIGATPLAGSGANWAHAHGCMWLEEAIREVVFSELVIAEFPHGAIPIIAILNTGLVSPTSNNSRDPSGIRVLIIRPSTIRIAHFERAPLFATSPTGFINKQSDDVKRTKKAIQDFENLSMQTSTQINKGFLLGDIFERLTEQLAFGHLSKLFNGGFFSSNLSIYGEFLDFGGMRSLPNWNKAKVLDNAKGFGDEIDDLIAIGRSLGFYFRKYALAGSKSIKPDDHLGDIRKYYNRAFDATCNLMWGLQGDEATEFPCAISAAMRGRFLSEQSIQVNYADIRNAYLAWSNNAPIDTNMINKSAFPEVLPIIDNLSGSFNHTSRKLHYWLTAARFLSTRPEIDIVRLQTQIFEHVVPHDTNEIANEYCVARLIDNTIGVSRRHWPRLPSHFTVHGHVTKNFASALFCRDIRTEENVIWIECLETNKELLIFADKIPSTTVNSERWQSHGYIWTGTIPVNEPFDTVREVAIGGVCVKIPPIMVRYGVL